MRNFKKINICIVFILCLGAPFTAYAAIPADLQIALDDAQAHAANPTTDWIPGADSHVPVDTPMVLIKPNSTDFGLTWDGSKLIVRTATKQQYWTSGAKTAGQNYTIPSFGAASDSAWITTGYEFTKFYDTYGNGATGTNAIKVVERSLGMNDTATHDAIVEYAVTADNNTIQRPTKCPDISTYTTDPAKYGSSTGVPFTYPDDMNTAGLRQKYADFYTDWISKAYGYTFPWTQLGYTYYWTSNQSTLSDIQGLSEFVLLYGVTVRVYGIYTTQSYIYTKNGAPGAEQYGNGYASFDITGPCDSVWAGHIFQSKTKTSTAGTNEITIENGGSVSGGQGILIASLNYDVTVKAGGVISGATSDKYGLSSTSNIAILFWGNTTDSGVVAAPSGENKVTNYGTISSPVTAIKVLNGNTTIANNAGGQIVGTTTAIDCSNSTGAVSITNRGTISGTIALNATAPVNFDIGNSALTVTGGLLSSLTFGANSATDFGSLTTTGTTVNTSTRVLLAPGGYIPNNTSFQVITGDASVSAVPGTITSASPIFTAAGALGGTTNLIVTATRAKNYTDFSPNSNQAAVGQVLNPIAAGGNPQGDMRTVLGGLDSCTSGSQINQALNTMSPIVDGAVISVTNDLLNKFAGLMILRLQDSKPEDDNNVWASGFGDYAKQSARSLSNGYDARLWGTTIGLDRSFMNNTLRFGLAQGFAWSSIGSKDSGGSLNITSYQTGLYGEYDDKKHPYILDALVTYGYNDYDGSRHIYVGNIDRIAKSDYGSHQLSVYTEGGYRIKNECCDFIPLIALNYMHLYAGGYTERGANSLDLTVNSQSYDSLQLGTGLRMQHAFGMKNTVITPEFHFRWFYDFINDTQQTLAKFAGGGTAFQTTGYRPPPSSFNIGARFELFNKKDATILFDCDTVFKEDYVEAGGSLTCKYSF